MTQQAAQTHPLVMSVFTELLDTRYQDLSTYTIFTEVGITAASFAVDTVCVLGFYAIMGNLHESVLDDPNATRIIRGIMGHELSHITMGHFSQYHINLREQVYKSPALEDVLITILEREADEDTIRRGLAQELQLARKYEQAFNANY